MCSRLTKAPHVNVLLTSTGMTPFNRSTPARTSTGLTPYHGPSLPFPIIRRKDTELNIAYLFPQRERIGCRRIMIPRAVMRGVGVYISRCGGHPWRGRQETP
jgi:hypothetical protein